MKTLVIGIEAAAAICHEANRAYCKYVLNDESHVPFEELSPEMKTSLVHGVYGVLTGKTPEESHDAWCNEKLLHGWTFGRFKDFDKKTHPNLVPYADLPPEEKRKDELFIAIVRTFFYGEKSPFPSVD